MIVELLSMTSNAEKLIEDAARTCYQSESDAEVGVLIKKLIKSGHDSVLEHASATFRISNVSRALSHQLVRHRLCSYSQQSQRYVKEDQFDYVIPESIFKLDPDEVRNFMSHMTQIQDMYNYWKSKGLKNEDARFVLPNACCTEVVMTANFREWRHIFSVRCDKHAQWEIRSMACHILWQLYSMCPNVFGDLCDKYISGNE